MINDKTIRNTIYVMIIILIGFGIFVYLNSKTGWLQANNPTTYEYSNGETTFLINRINDMGYTGSQIMFYFPNSNKPYALDLRYGPLELEDVSVDRSIKQRILDDTTIFFTIDPNAGLTGKTTLAAYELTKVLNNEYFFYIPVNSSMTSDYKDYPVKTCEDANRAETVFWLRLGKDNSIKTEGNCVILTGRTEDDLIKEADRIVLHLLGIMK